METQNVMPEAVLEYYRAYQHEYYYKKINDPAFRERKRRLAQESYARIRAAKKLDPNFKPKRGRPPKVDVQQDNSVKSQS